MGTVSCDSDDLVLIYAYTSTRYQGHERLLKRKPSNECIPLLIFRLSSRGAQANQGWETPNFKKRV